MARVNILGTAQQYIKGSATSFSISLGASTPAEGWILCICSGEDVDTGNATGGPWSIPALEKIVTSQSINGRYHRVWAASLSVTGSLNSLVVNKTSSLASGNFVVIWGTGPAPQEWVLGASQRRQDYGSSPRNWARCVPLTSEVQSYRLKMLAIGCEATNAIESPDTVLSVDNDISQVIYAGQGGLVNQNIATIFVGQKTVEENQPQGTTTILYRNSNDTNGWGMHIGIPDLDDEVIPEPTPFSLSVITSTGLTSVRTLGIKTDVGISPVDIKGVWDGRMLPLLDGYTSVNEMLNAPEMYWSHRGGSRDFPEMSRYAYEKSARLGWGALEFSMARTSDGVWFGLHDETLDRTSGLTGSPIASNLTWNQVQQYTIQGSVAANNPSQSSRPYMHFEELLDLFGNSYVLVIDPKYVWDGGDMFDILAGYYGSVGEATEHVVVKTFGVGGTTLRTRAQSAGYATWGYFYEHNETDFADRAPTWDLLGMDYSASQSSWDALHLAAPSKRIIGHICPTLASVETARSKGATGFQCSGVKSIYPI